VARAPRTATSKVLLTTWLPPPSNNSLPIASRLRAAFLFVISKKVFLSLQKAARKAFYPNNIREFLDNISLPHGNKLGKI
jgi:hypothetical protein